MKKILLSVLIGFIGIHFSYAQVQIDKPIQMTGTTSTNRQIKNVGEATQATDAANAETVQSGKLNYADAAGSVNAFTVSLSPAPSAYTSGMIVNFKANNAITGAATINVNGLGAKTIKKQVTTDLAANDILAGQLVSLIFDGSNFQMLGGSSSSTTSSASTLSVLTSAQRGALVNPAVGTLIYNTETGSLEIFDGNYWSAVQPNMSLVGVDPNLRKADFIGGAIVGSSGFTIGNKIYIGTGYASGTGVTNKFFEYDIATNVWTRKADFPGTARTNAVGFAINGKGYLGSGETINYPSSYFSDFWEYNPITDSWRTISNLPAAGRGNACSFVIGQFGYVCSGYYITHGYSSSTSTYLQDLWQYNPSSNSWTQKASIDVLHASSIGYEVGGYGYIIVGNGTDIYGNSTNRSRVQWKYDPILNTWNGETTLPNNSGTYSLSGVGASYNGKGYIIEGSNLNEYDPVAKLWKTKNKVGLTTDSNGYCFIINGIGYIGRGIEFWSFKP